MSPVKRAIAGVVAILLLAACVGSGGTVPDPTRAPGATLAPTRTAAPEPPEPGYVTREEYGDDWPFTVPAGTIHCTEGAAFEAGRLYVTFSHAGEPGVEYTVNGSARDLGFPELDETILVDYPDRTKTLALITRGLELCD